MENRKQTYLKRITRFTGDLKKIKRQLLASSMLRLSVFLAMVIVVYLVWGYSRWVIAVILIGAFLFFYLVSRHTDLKKKRDKIKALLSINQTERAVLEGHFSDLPTGDTYKNDQHFFSQDIDLFGKNSFFQYLNRTSLKEGEEKLAHLLTKNDINHIERRQEAIVDLSRKIDFRQTFSALAKMAAAAKNDTPSSVKENLHTLKNHSFFTPRYARALSTIFSLLSIAGIVLYFIGLLSLLNLSLWLILGLVITGVYLKRVNALSGKVSAMQLLFNQYHQLLELLENTSFSAALLKEQQALIATETKKASQILQSFSEAIGALDQRNNLLFGFLGNGFLLWDLRQASRLENWIKNYASTVDGWFGVIARMDAYNTLGNFAFNHPRYTYPIITDNHTIMQAKGAVHPLIPPTEAVANDVAINREQFFIITGANMAGKSTFLRTVSLQIVMSNCGLPVCAKACEYTPVKLITSMRTSDSLAEESSYFYAELSRLKFIIDQLKEEDYFVVLDEILKGTNSADKASGSKKFLQKLVASHSTGIIATHDLSLCEVARELPPVKNYYFDAQIIDDELYFDYTFKPGICQNMNASFLLRKMDIVDD